MRIRSDFHDYYDSSQALGQDHTLIYDRHEEELPFDNPYIKEIPFMGDAKYNPNAIYYKQTMIGFCGKLYPVIQVNTPSNHSGMYKKDRETRKFCYSLDDIDKWVKDKFKERAVDGYFRKRWDRDQDWPWECRRCQFEKFFQKFDEIKNREFSIFEDKRTPIFHTDVRYSYKIYQDRHFIVINGRLKDFEFFRVFDPYSAYQEISMFLGNMAAPRKPLPTISDEVMLQVKGFDLKASFRKEKRVKK